MVSGPMVAQSRYESHFAYCLVTNCDTAGIVLPWEKGTYKDIFNVDEVSHVVLFPIFHARWSLTQVTSRSR